MNDDQITKLSDVLKPYLFKETGKEAFGGAGIIGIATYALIEGLITSLHFTIIVTCTIVVFTICRTVFKIMKMKYGNGH